MRATVCGHGATWVFELMMERVVLGTGSVMISFVPCVIRKWYPVGFGERDETDPE